MDAASHLFFCTVFRVREFLSSGLPILHRLVEQGYYLPVLRVVANLTPLLAQQRKMVMDEQRSVGF